MTERERLKIKRLERALRACFYELRHCLSDIQKNEVSFDSDDFHMAIERAVKLLPDLHKYKTDIFMDYNK